ncbi:hypothetical protein [Myxosarcina sp. GI1(2024)]
MSLPGLLSGDTPDPERSARVTQAASGYFFVEAIAFIILPALPYAFATPPLPETVLFLLWGFFLVRFSFSVRSRFSASRVSVSFRRVVGLALSRGCCSWLLRSSSRSFSGSVVWCGFVSRSRAAAFAFVVSRLVGVVVWVRPGWCSVGGFVWFVSVPVVR